MFCSDEGACVRFGESFDEELAAATAPRWLWPCGAEPSGECAEDSAVGTSGGQEDTDASHAFHHARGDLDQTKAQSVELCVAERRARRGGGAHRQQEPVGGGVKDQAELVGFGIAA